MTFRRFTRSVACALVMSAAGFAAANPVTAATLPRLEADSLGGTHVVLPTDAGGKPLVMLIAFGRSAEDDVKTWSRELLGAHAPQNAAVYVVVVADGHTFVGRRRIRKEVASAALGSKEQINNDVLITFSGTGWRDLVVSGDNKAAGLVVCDARGDVVYAKQVRFSAANLADVLNAAK